MRLRADWYVYKIRSDGMNAPLMLILMPPIPEMLRDMLVNRMLDGGQWIETSMPAKEYFGNDVCVAVYN